MINLINKGIVDISFYRIEKINDRYRELKILMRQIEEKKIYLTIDIAKLDKQMYEIKTELEKLEEEILKDLK